MLRELNISNFALIDNSNIVFDRGLSVLVGETGSGKSIIIDALSIALGARASKDKIKTGSSKSILQAVFDISDNEAVKGILEEQGLPSGDTLLINREININSGNISRINGIVVNLNVLNSITSNLIDIFGQFEHQALMSSSYQRNLLDSFGDEDYHKYLMDYGKLYSEYKMLVKEYEELNVNESFVEREIDLLKYQISEIEMANLDSYNEDETVEELNKLENVNNLRDELGIILNTFSSDEYSSSLMELVSQVMRASQNIDKYDKSNEELSKRLSVIYYELEDISSEFVEYGDSLYFDEERYDELVKRVDTVNSLKKKYGNEISEILAFYDDANDRLNAYLNHDENLLALKSKIDSAKKSLVEGAEYIRNKRIEYSKRLEKTLIEELMELKMEHAKFSVKINDVPINQFGRDEIIFMISTNPGEDLKELSQVSSGGEISRIMLSFKNLLANLDEINTLIFDEIDTGISGNTAKVVGHKIKRISSDRQVICISHLPQIISAADNCYLIYKETDGGKTKSNVRKLDRDEFVQQLAIIIDGDNYNVDAYNTAVKMIDDYS